jgi:hypothetical protein
VGGPERRRVPVARDLVQVVEMIPGDSINAQHHHLRNRWEERNTTQSKAIQKPS